MVALALAIAVGYLVGGWTGTILSFAIGIFKAVLIILYFMHVRYGDAADVDLRRRVISLAGDPAGHDAQRLHDPPDRRVPRRPRP